jgi:peroxiredoxin
MKARWLPAILLICFVSLSAQSPSVPEPIGFSEPPSRRLEVGAFADEEVAGLLRTLDALLAAPGNPGLVFGNFARRLQQGRLSPAQESRVLAHLARIGRTAPRHADLVGRTAFVIKHLMIGKVAPEIEGADLDGAPFRLSQYRGQVVVLNFSAEWCGICRTAYPYERLLLELYAGWPFALLAVETGSSASAIKAARESQGLRYRAWWDAPEDPGRGAIASAWRISGFPAVYVLDGRGVIRFIDLRQEDLLKAVRQLLTEHADAIYAESAKAQGDGSALEARSVR